MLDDTIELLGVYARAYPEAAALFHDGEYCWPDVPYGN